MTSSFWLLFIDTMTLSLDDNDNNNNVSLLASLRHVVCTSSFILIFVYSTRRFVRGADCLTPPSMSEENDDYLSTPLLLTGIDNGSVRRRV